MCGFGLKCLLLYLTRVPESYPKIELGDVACVFLLQGTKAEVVLSIVGEWYMKHVLKVFEKPPFEFVDFLDSEDGNNCA